jgi:hypothetical protein
VAGPGRLPHRAFDSRVQTHRPAVLPVRWTDHQLDLNPAVGRDHQRRLQRQVLQHPTTDLITGPDRQLHERRAGQQHPPEHRVISQPGMSPQRQPAGEQISPTIGQRHPGTQQRMLR